jgi:four helix bundle protein
VGAASFRELTVWQKAMDLAVEVYRLSASFPADERFRLTAQVTRAAVSVPANIAEGNSRATKKDYAHFVSIARGSLAETETFRLLALRLRYLDEARPLPLSPSRPKSEGCSPLSAPASRTEPDPSP